jgi:hypothetical protein
MTANDSMEMRSSYEHEQNQMHAPVLFGGRK